MRLSERAEVFNPPEKRASRQFCYDLLGKWLDDKGLLAMAVDGNKSKPETKTAANLSFMIQFPGWTRFDARVHRHHSTKL